MKPVGQWFSPLTEYRERREDPDWDGERRWYQKEWLEHWGPRWRWIIGDVFSEPEHEGGDYIGPRFEVGLDLFQLTGQFDGWFEGARPSWSAKFEDHSFSVTFWRWGIYVAVCGRRIRES